MQHWLWRLWLYNDLRHSNVDYDGNVYDIGTFEVNVVIELALFFEYDELCVWCGLWWHCWQGLICHWRWWWCGDNIWLETWLTMQHSMRLWLKESLISNKKTATCLRHGNSMLRQRTYSTTWGMATLTMTTMFALSSYAQWSLSLLVKKLFATDVWEEVRAEE